MKWLRDNGLTVLLMVLFALSFIGMMASGWAEFSHDLRLHGRPGISFAAYVVSGEFLSAVFENWESEFLQMAAYVVLTAYFFQRGSAESRDPDEAPGEPRQVYSWIYEHSLGLALAALFVLSFVLHWITSYSAAERHEAIHGSADPGLFGYLADPQFWFESFQNWQSEFLSTAVLVVLSIFLRYRNSPESKPVEASHADTGAS